MQVDDLKTYQPAKVLSCRALRFTPFVTRKALRTLRLDLAKRAEALPRFEALLFLSLMPKGAGQ